MSISRKNWTILIADDQSDVHSITQLVLDNVIFDNRKIRLLSAYSEQETREYIDKHDDICVILLDVVMESEQSGFNIIEYIRTTKKNNRIQIILRTGQPGSAPERSVIEKYDINDYKEKTELTSTKLYTSVISAIRSYSLLSTIEDGRNGLQNIIRSSKDILQSHSVISLAEAVLEQIAILTRTPTSSIVARNSSGFIATNGETLHNFTIVRGTGEFEDASGKKLTDVIQENDIPILQECLHSPSPVFHKNVYAGYFISSDNIYDLVFFRTDREFTDFDEYFLNLFQSNFEMMFRNLRLHELMKKVQSDVIFKLGDVIEHRSGETGDHVRRVAEHTYLLSQLAGLPQEDCDLYRLASTMHDIGKIGISDTILLKPGKISDEEFETMKSHTTIGHKILSGSEKDIFDTAANISLYHHEQWDGYGYPTKIKEKEIPIEGRIVSITDVFDALSHTRCYKEAWDKAQIIEFFGSQREKKFDPILCEIFLKHIDEFYHINDTFNDAS